MAVDTVIGLKLFKLRGHKTLSHQELLSLTNKYFLFVQDINLEEIAASVIEFRIFLSFELKGENNIEVCFQRYFEQNKLFFFYLF